MDLVDVPHALVDEREIANSLTDSGMRATLSKSPLIERVSFAVTGL